MNLRKRQFSNLKQWAKEFLDASHILETTILKKKITFGLSVRHQKEKVKPTNWYQGFFNHRDIKLGDSWDFNSHWRYLPSNSWILNSWVRTLGEKKLTSDSLLSHYSNLKRVHNNCTKRHKMKDHLQLIVLALSRFWHFNRSSDKLFLPNYTSRKFLFNQPKS